MNARNFECDICKNEYKRAHRGCGCGIIICDDCWEEHEIEVHLSSIKRKIFKRIKKFEVVFMERYSTARN